ncbi:MAG: hypothetical protein JWQ79_847 [Mucilaginibacter sp.]|jgi:hypothetical protein|nr:hypothetical protein [Mucilaginibacter sp.]
MSYVVASFLIILAHGDKSGMCGPGLGLIIYPVVFIWSFMLICKYFGKVIKDKSFWGLFIIHFVGFTILLIYVNCF